MKYGTMVLIGFQNTFNSECGDVCDHAFDRYYHTLEHAKKAVLKHAEIYNLTVNNFENKNGLYLIHLEDNQFYLDIDSEFYPAYIIEIEIITEV